MAKKNNRGFAGLPGFEAIMMQQAYKSYSDPKWCRYCGQDIMQPTANSTKDLYSNAWYSDWEIQNNAHSKCHSNQRRR